MTKMIAEFDAREIAVLKKSLVGFYTKLEQQDAVIPYGRMISGFMKQREDTALTKTEEHEEEVPVSSKEIEKLLIKLFMLEE